MNFPHGEQDLAMFHLSWDIKLAKRPTYNAAQSGLRRSDDPRNTAIVVQMEVKAIGN